MLKTKPTKPPFTQLGIGNSILKITNPMANLLMKEAVIAFVLFSNFIKIIGIMDTMPNITPAITPFTMFVIIL
jgi:hypothetical protein